MNNESIHFTGTQINYYFISNKQHLPIDDFCKDVALYRIDSKWNGNVILEYLFEFHDHMLYDNFNT